MITETILTTLNKPISELKFHLKITVFFYIYIALEDKN